MTPRILIIEDDPIVRETIASYLLREHFVVDLASDARQLCLLTKSGKFDIIILDINLPGKDGLTITRQLRAAGSTVGIILVTSRDDTVDRILGIELGADDYVTKPFEGRELMARVKGLLRRMEMDRQGPEKPAIVRFRGWTLDHGARRLSDPEGEAVRLSRGEFDLLAHFVAYAGRVLSREQLLDGMGDCSGDRFDRSVDVAIGKLRRKLCDDPRNPEMIVTMHGVGYVFAPPVETV